MNVQYTRLGSKFSAKVHKRKLPSSTDCSKYHCRIPLTVWVPLVTCVVLMFISDIFQIQTYTVAKIKRLSSEELPEDDPQQLRGFLIKSEGCRIAYMDPFDRSVLHYIYNMEAPNCADGKPPLYDASRTSLFLLYTSLRAYNVDSAANLSCCYTVFWRTPPKGRENDDKVYYSKKCIRLGDSADIKNEFVRVTCESGNETIYRDYFSFVPLKEYGNTQRVASSVQPKGEAPLNVLVVGLDGVSRVNLHRQMPRTVEYLRNISAVELLGYNKVGDNTFPNLIPVLTGFSEDQLRKSCWSDNKRFDKCPYVWDAYKRRGFATAFGEDSAWMSMFNYMRKGFHHQPTDYMWSAFNRESERQIGNHHMLNVVQCVGGRAVYKTLLDYIGKFVETMHVAKRRYFAFFWSTSLSHDYLNMPNIGDETYKEFFDALWESGNLENTALFFMSDHGIRWGEIRQTYQGRMEERLPFLHVVLPRWFREKYSLSYRNLRRNVRRLTTPFDLHETLVHLTNFGEASDEGLAPEKMRGYSLFKVISPKRTCLDASISSHWCACHQSFDIERNSSLVQQGAEAIVDHMNFQLKGYAQCAVLTLKTVLNARMMSHNESILNGDVNFRDYMLTVQTQPGEGTFESTVRHYVGENSTSFKIMGTVSRLNLYGRQSLCITNFHLKLYCYCKTLLEALSF